MPITWCGRIAIARAFRLRVLPFGSIHFGFAFRFMLPSTHFYDDYVLQPDCPNCEATAELLLPLLGWNYAKEGKKALGF